MFMLGQLLDEDPSLDPAESNSWTVVHVRKLFVESQWLLFAPLQGLPLPPALRTSKTEASQFCVYKSIRGNLVCLCGPMKSHKLLPVLMPEDFSRDAFLSFGGWVWGCCADRVPLVSRFGVRVPWSRRPRGRVLPPHPGDRADELIRPRNTHPASRSEKHSWFCRHCLRARLRARSKTRDPNMGAEAETNETLKEVRVTWHLFSLP